MKKAQKELLRVLAGFEHYQEINGGQFTLRGFMDYLLELYEKELKEDK